MTIMYYVDWRGGFVENRYYVDGRGGFVDNLVLRRPEGRVC